MEAMHGQVWGKWLRLSIPSLGEPPPSTLMCSPKPKLSESQCLRVFIELNLQPASTHLPGGW